MKANFAWKFARFCLVLKNCIAHQKTKCVSSSLKNVAYISYQILFEFAVVSFFELICKNRCKKALY
jgi:hypothetical protein